MGDERLGRGHDRLLSGARTAQFKQVFELTSSAAVVLASDPDRGTRMARNNGALKLEADEVVLTLDHLKARVAERFPASGLSKVCDQLTAVAPDHRPTGPAAVAALSGPAHAGGRDRAPGDRRGGGADRTAGLAFPAFVTSGR